MEFEFLRDPTFGGYHAKFSMEHELFAVWLMEEIGDNKERLSQLQVCIDKAQKLSFEDVQFVGREYLLTLNKDEVHLVLNSALDGVGDYDSYEQQDLYVNDQHHANSCGLEDFVQMIAAWREFLVK